MSFYALDRFSRFGLSTARAGFTLETKQAAEAQSTAARDNVMLMSSGLSPILMNYVAASTPVANSPPKTEQQKAEDELAALNKQLNEAEQAAAVQETLDIGEPAKTPWLLYGGLG